MNTLSGVSAAALCALMLGAGPAQADPASLPSVPSGARPGPDILYAPAPAAPQLQNTAPWKAPPILVSGAEAYRDGEFLYQDYLNDDYGGAGASDPTDPFSTLEQLFSPKHGTMTYPTNTAVYANNAADLVELRVKPLAGQTAFRVTLNTMKDPSVAAFTIALGDSPVQHAWPFGAGVSSPAQRFLTVHGSTAVLTDATSGAVITPAPTASVDTTRRQVDVRVPDAAWDPGTSTVRMAAGVGLWDGSAGTYAKPGPVASATQPGGASPSGEALFNMAFRTSEPIPHIYDPGIANTIAEGHVFVAADGSWWRERRQADVLASGDVSPFAAEVDFAKLAHGVDDESGVPQSGHIDRILASQFQFGQGVDYNVKCLTVTSGDCTGRYLGQLQPYALYVPAKPLPANGFGLVVSMHGLSANYNEFLGSHEAEEMGERGTGSIFASPESRGPDGGYKSYAEADVFEMWADIARHYKLNPDMSDVTGYSMGGEGTYELATRWPDLWAKAFPIVGPPTSTASFTSLRNVPVMAWYGQTDELVGPEMSEQAFLNAEQAGIRYDHWVFTPAGHITEGNNDEYGPAAAFFGEATVDRHPLHVTYMVDPSQVTAAVSSADHAYWLSGVKVRDASAVGKLDVRSLAGGVADPPVEPVALSAGTLNGGSHGPIPYTRRTLAWGTPSSQARANELDITATNVAAVTIDASRAGVTCDAKLKNTSDGPLKVTMIGCGGTSSSPSSSSSTTPAANTNACASGRHVQLRLALRVRGQRVVSARIFVAGRQVALVRGRRLHAPVDLRGLPGSGFRVRIVSVLRHGRAVVTTRSYRACAAGRPAAPPPRSRSRRR